MDGRAVVETLEGMASSFAALADAVRHGAGVADGASGAAARDAAGDGAGGASANRTSDGADGVGLSVGTDPLDGTGPLDGVDPLRDQADGCLDALGELARMEAGMAAVKVQFAAEYAAAGGALAVRAVETTPLAG